MAALIRNPSSPTRLNSSSASSRRSAAELPVIASGKSTLSSAVFQGNSVASWNIMPISERGPVILRPPISIVPPVGVSSPATIISNVLLPQPLGPRIETNSPDRISTVTRSTASTVAPSAT